MLRILGNPEPLQVNPSPLTDPGDRAVAAYIGLGSNLGDRVRRVRSALSHLDRLPQTRVNRRSSLYRSVPVGVVDQPLFINAVVRVRTRLTPEALLVELQKIERRFGRIRKLRWGPRSLDLDILVYGGVVRDEPALVVPHPGIPHRPFVLYPLLEIAPNLDVPGMGTPADMARRCPGPAPRRLRIESRYRG